MVARHTGDKEWRRVRAPLISLNDADFDAIGSVFDRLHLAKRPNRGISLDNKKGMALVDDHNEPVKLRDKAYQSFTQHLLARDFHPGQFVSQRQLVTMTGLPLGAIRELIPRLEAEGLIKTVPQRGLQIAHIDLNLIREAFQFRLFIEKSRSRFSASRLPMNCCARCVLPMKIRSTAR